MPARHDPLYAEALGKAEALLRRLGPKTAFLPWRRDPHCDHRRSWALFTHALAEAGVAPAIYEYAIWLDELGAPEDHPRPGEMTRVDMDVEAWLAVKRRAIGAHRSQLGLVIGDDPGGFRLGEATLRRLIGPVETYWRPWPGR